MNKTIMILGGDGYLGWSLGLYRAFNTDDKVILVDSYLKRDLQKSLGIKELFEFPLLPERIRSYNKTGRRNLSSLSINVANYESIKSVIDRYKPDVIVNAAHQPSAPYSMMNPVAAASTIRNNEKTCLNTLWAVRDHCPESIIINIGSAGVYQSIDTNMIPENRKTLNFYHHGMLYAVKDSWLSMQASDFYHQSKVHTFGLTEMCMEMWKLKAITVQQSTIFGQCAAAALNAPNLYSRFSYDHIFGTVLNRFACQAVKGLPLTVYGDGSSQTNIICLCDTIKGISDLMDLDVAPGTHKVVNHFTETMNIQGIAEKVIQIYGKGEIKYIKNPRKEKACSQIKAFENLSTKLDSNIVISIRNTLDFAERFSYNINLNQIEPTIMW
jgi:UDP-sulfoquinovose synthase